MMQINVNTHTTYSSSLAQVPICPDGLKYEHLGVADNFRGQVVRAFFWLIKWWD
jgi:hypothetical protein